MIFWCILCACLQVVLSVHPYDLFQYNCNNGEVVDLEKFCDGTVDCRDGSDETLGACLHTKCPAYAFQCAYGACIQGTAECNGIQDCMDKSDEATVRCEGTLEAYGIGNCSDNEFKCRSGECIQEYNACDGKSDCRDTSDETVDLCSAFYCPAFAFQCGYGACIPGNSKCDGIVDCVDASDEISAICGKHHTTVKPLETYPSSTISTITTTTEIDTGFFNRECVIEAINNTKISALIEERPLVAGQTVSHLTNIKYECGLHFVLEGTITNTCLNGHWNLPPPKCLKCCNYVPLFGITFTAECEYNGTRIPCNETLKPGTRVKLACKNGYRKPLKIVRDEIVCDEHGEWDYSPYRCKPICGIAAIEGEPEISFPWNVGVYDYLYEQKCAGTIINAKIVLSAAHCFWDEKRNQRIDMGNFRVAVGKHYRNFFAKETYAQIFNISEIHIPPEYEGSKLYYQSDIAILILANYIIFNERVLPVCISWRRDKYPDYESTPFRAVSSWRPNVSGQDESGTIKILKFNLTDCTECGALQNDKLITNVKFCIKSHTEAICRRDGGAGVVIYNVKDGVRKYTLNGVISHVNSNNTCSVGNHCTLCTDTKLYGSFIGEFDGKYRPK